MFGGINDGGSTETVEEGEGAASAAAISALTDRAGVLEELGDDCAAAEVADAIAKPAIRCRKNFIFFAPKL